MEIQKIFTDLYNSERIYSVLMNEEELSLFSEIQKEFGNAHNKALKKAWELKQANLGGYQQFKSVGHKTVPVFSQKEVLGGFRKDNYNPKVLVPGSAGKIRYRGEGSVFKKLKDASVNAQDLSRHLENNGGNVIKNTRNINKSKIRGELQGVAKDLKNKGYANSYTDQHIAYKTLPQYR